MPDHQPVPAPGSADGYRQLLDSGRLVTLSGSTLQVSDCDHCGGTTVGETCPQSLRCPTCHAPAGRPCRRPSGHELMGARWHTSRTDAADAVDLQRQRDDDPTLPAPWPSGD